GRGRVLLVGADDAGRPTLDPPGAVDALADPPTFVRDRPATLVEGDAVERHAVVADAAENEARGDRLALARRHRADVAGLVALEAAAPQLHRRRAPLPQ